MSDTSARWRDNDPYTTREIRDKFDGFSDDLREIKALLTGNTFVRADVYSVEARALQDASATLKSRIDTMQSTIRGLVIALIGAIVTATVTVVLTVHP